MTTESSAPTLGTAIRLLAGRCDWANSLDGAGFNAADAAFGHSLAGQAEEEWSPKKRRAAWKMLRKYRGQLSGAGINFDAIPEPPESDPSHHLAIVPKTLAPIAPASPPIVAAFTPQLTIRGILGPGGVIARQLPGYECRDPQIQMAELVEAAIAKSRHAAIEAGTGTGKSLGYLVPAILSGQRTVCSTADKALQVQIWAKDIPFLQSVLPQPFRAAILKGRSNYLCLHRFAEMSDQLSGSLPGMADVALFKSTDAALAWPEVVTWAAETNTGDLETAPFAVPLDLWSDLTVDSDSCLGKRCPQFGNCWVEKAKTKASEAEVIIVNHALLLRDLELRFQTDGHASVLPDDVSVIVLDEAHHLEDIATNAFGVEISLGRWTRIARRIENLTVKHKAVKGQPSGTEDQDEAEKWSLKAGAVQSQMESLFGAIQDRFAESRSASMILRDERPIANAALQALRFFTEEIKGGALHWLTPDQQTSWGKLGDQTDRLTGHLEWVVTPGTEDVLVRFAELSNGRIVLHAKPIDVSDLLAERLFEVFPTVIATSATIATDAGMAYWRSRVGLEQVDELIVSSPFDYRRAALIYLPQDGQSFDPSRFRQEGSIEYVERLAGEIERLLLASDGRAFVLFTSFRILRDVYDRLAPRLRWTLLRQGDLPRPELVRRFREDTHSVLFGVKSFWEGVDVQGEALSLVIIDKLPFTPPDDPIWAARCDAVNRAANDRWAWFNQLAIPVATIALKQGFGRLIRTKTDRGVVAILDGRLTTKPYGRRIVRSLPPATVTRSLDAVRAFFGAS